METANFSKKIHIILGSAFQCQDVFSAVHSVDTHCLFVSFFIFSQYRVSVAKVFGSGAKVPQLKFTVEPKNVFPSLLIPVSDYWAGAVDDKDLAVSSDQGDT